MAVERSNADIADNVLIPQNQRPQLVPPWALQMQQAQLQMQQSLQQVLQMQQHMAIQIHNNQCEVRLRRSAGASSTN